jgi:hypothetical protein
MIQKRGKSVKPIKVVRTRTLAEYIETSYSFEVYCSHLDSLYKVEAIEWKKMLPRPLAAFYENLKVTFSEIAKEAKVGVEQLVAAFKDKDLFKLFTSIRFNLKVLSKALFECLSLFRKGLDKIFEELKKSGVLDSLEKGTKHIDAILEKYPLLKKLAGPAMAGLLLYMWMSMSFLGDPSWDFDMSDIIDALAGRFTIYDLFGSPQGLTTITAFLIGSVTGISFPWLTSNLISLVVALIYTGAKKLKDTEVTKSLKSLIPTQRL